MFLSDPFLLRNCGASPFKSCNGETMFVTDPFLLHNCEASSFKSFTPLCIQQDTTKRSKCAKVKNANAFLEVISIEQLFGPETECFGSNWYLKDTLRVSFKKLKL